MALWTNRGTLLSHRDCLRHLCSWSNYLYVDAQHRRTLFRNVSPSYGCLFRLSANSELGVRHHSETQGEARCGTSYGYGHQ